MAKNAYIKEDFSTGGVDTAENLKLTEEYLVSETVRGRSRTSVKVEKTTLVDFLRHLARNGVPVRDVTAEMIDGFRRSMVERNFRASTIEVRLRTVAGFFRHLERSGQLFINPATGMRIPRKREPLNVPTVEEVERLMAAADSPTRIGIRDRAILDTAWSTACLPRELLVLKVSDIDPDKETLEITARGGKRRTVSLESRAIKSLAEYLEKARPDLLVASGLKTGALWIAYNGHPVTGHGLRQVFERHKRKAGLNRDMSINAVRRARAARMLEDGIPPDEIRKFLGHANLKTLARFLNVPVRVLKSKLRKGDG